jgi:hypothetical protein
MKSSDQPVYDDGLVTGYLLGFLSPEEMERCDERSIADEEFAWRLSAVENDLVDAYVRDELSGETLDRFRSAYLASPRGREKVAFAETFWSTAQRSAAPQAGGRQAVARPGAALRWALAAAALVVTAIGGYLFRDNQRLRGLLAHTQSERVALEQRTRDLQSRLDAQPPTARPTVSLVLLAQTRGAGQPPSISAMRADHLRLELELESDDFPDYEFVLKDSTGSRVLFRGGQLKSANRRVSVEFSAALLKSQTYLLELSGTSAGATEFVAAYPFRAVIH